MNHVDAFRSHLADCPLIAIIRGVTPSEAESVGGALLEAGFRIVDRDTFLASDPGLDDPHREIVNTGLL